MRYFPEAVDDLDLVYGMYRWGKATVDAENLVINDHRQREEVEHIREVMPYIRIAVFSRTFGVESIGLGYAARLMVAANEVDSVGVAQFEAYKQ